MADVIRRGILSAVRIMAIATVGFAPESAVAQRPSGVTVTPGKELALIQKDVGVERWAISVNRQTGLTTGNVFYSDGREPTFLYCPRTSQTDAEWVFACEVTGPCLSAGCASRWTNIGRVAIDASFFKTPDPGGGSLSLDGVVIEATENVPNAIVGCDLHARLHNVNDYPVTVTLYFNAFDSAGTVIGFAVLAAGLPPGGTSDLGSTWHSSFGPLNDLDCSSISSFEIHPPLSQVVR